MHSPSTPLAPTTCASCDADGPVRVIDADGASQVCVLHAIGLLTIAEQGAPVALVIDAEATR